MSGPVLYFPLGESAGALEAGNIARNFRTERLVVTQVGSGGTLEFGAGTPLPTAPLTTPLFTPVNVTNGLNLQTQFLEPLTTSSDTFLEVACWFTAAASAVDTFLVNLSGNAGREEISLALCLEPDGTPFVRYSARAGFATVAPHTTAPNNRDGSLHHFVAILNLVAPDMTVRLLCDNVNDGPGGGGNFNGVGSSFPNFTKLTVGGSLVNDLHTGTIAHVALYAGTAANSDARWSDRYLAGTTGFSGERSDQRIARYARLAGIPAAETDI